MQSKYILTIIAVFIFFMMGCNETGDSSKVEQFFETPSLSTGMEITTKVENDAIEVYWKFDENVKSYILDFGDRESGLNEHISLNKKTTNYKISNLAEDEIYLFRLVSIFNDGAMSTSKVIEAKIATTNRLLQSDNGPKT